MAEELPAVHIGGMRDGGEVQDDVPLARRGIDADRIDGKRVGIFRPPTVAEAGEIDPTEPVDRLLFFHRDDLRRCLRLLCLADHGRVAEPEFAAARDHPLVEGEHRRAALIGSCGRDDRTPVQLRDLLGVHERKVLEERPRLDLGKVRHRALAEPVAGGVVIGELISVLDDGKTARTHLVVAELVVPVVGQDARSHRERVGEVRLMVAALRGRVVVPVEQHAVEEPAGPGGVELHFGIVPAQLLDVAGRHHVDGGEAVADDRRPPVELVFLGHVRILSNAPYSLIAPASPAPSPPEHPAAFFAAEAASPGTGFFSLSASSRMEYR